MPSLSGPRHMDFLKLNNEIYCVILGELTSTIYTYKITTNFEFIQIENCVSANKNTNEHHQGGSHIEI